MIAMAAKLTKPDAAIAGMPAIGPTPVAVRVIPDVTPKIPETIPATIEIPF